MCFWQRGEGEKKLLVHVFDDILQSCINPKTCKFLSFRINKVYRRQLTEVLKIHNILNDDSENGKAGVSVLI